MSLSLESGDPGGREGMTRRDFLRLGGAGAALLAAGGVLEACGSSGSSSGTSSSTTTTTGTAPSGPKRGGNLMVAVLGGSSSDTLDGDAEVSTPDLIRVTALYNGLVTYDISGTTVVNELAEELEPNSDATQWTIRVRPDVTFHNGKTLGAEDVAYTIRRIANPSKPLNGYSVLSAVDLNNIETLDARTSSGSTSSSPWRPFPSSCTRATTTGSSQLATTPRTRLVPARSSTRASHLLCRASSTATRNYWKSGVPYLDSVTIVDSYSNDTTALSALQAGNVDVYSEASLTVVPEAEKIAGVKAVISNTGQWIPFTMRVDQAPFNDVRVRQAMRYIVDRPQVVEVAFDGYAAVGNDVFGQHDPDYDASLKREQDIEQAKFLLKKAGHENLTIELVTSDIAGGAVNCAQVLAQQAKAAGVTINLNNVPSSTFFGPNYLKWVFAQDYWDYNPYLSQVAQATLPTSPFNECHFDNPTYIALYAQANSTLDAAKRREITHEMQMIDFTEGGYIIPAYNKIVDLMSTGVNGFPSDAGAGIPLGNCSWETAWKS